MPTIHDIAKKAGVSPGLVSLALNGKPRVNADTAERIIRIANSLGYRRRVTRTPGAGTVRFVRLSRSDSAYRNSHAPFFADYIEGAEDYFKERGYRFEVSSYPAEDPEAIARAMAADNLQGAVVLATELTAGEVAALGGCRLPLVVLDACHDFLPFDHCNMNNRDAVHRMVSALDELGHTNIGVVASANPTFNLADRAAAFDRSLELLGLASRAGWIYPVPADAAGAAEVLVPAFRRRRPPPALVCLTDNLAYGCLQALATLKLRVPEDVSVMGFDDLPSSRVMHPPLSTVRVPTHAMGAAAARMLDARIASPDKPVEKTLFTCELIMRKSVGPAPERRRSTGV